VETSEYLAELLKRQGIPHNVLNAKEHAREAEIIKDAGQPGAVTIATNMAGRGVDIKLGDGVVDLGGLYVLGTERHAARRIDNQLRGRSGRQGDPGSSRFFVSLEDELMRRFGGASIAGLMDRLGLEEDVPLEHPWVTRAIENAQQKVEAYNFDIRKHVVEYDDVLNRQRDVIYGDRDRVLFEENLKPLIMEWVEETLVALTGELLPTNRHAIEMGPDKGEDSPGRTDGAAARRAPAARTSNGAARQPVHIGAKVGRNDPCPCGSGKKFKRCHGA